VRDAQNAGSAVSDSGNAIARDAQIAATVVSTTGTVAEAVAEDAASTAADTAGKLAGDAADLGESVLKSVADI